jgi:hypothetical protein
MSTTGLNLQPELGKTKKLGSINFSRILAFIVLAGCIGTLLVDALYLVIPDPAIALPVLLLTIGVGCLALFGSVKNRRSGGTLARTRGGLRRV